MNPSFTPSGFLTSCHYTFLMVTVGLSTTPGALAPSQKLEEMKHEVVSHLLIHKS